MAWRAVRVPLFRFENRIAALFITSHRDRGGTGCHLWCLEVDIARQSVLGHGTCGGVGGLVRAAVASLERVAGRQLMEGRRLRFGTIMG